MSESKRIQTYDVYDPKDVIKDIEVSTIYITSLQNIISDMIIAGSKIDTVGETFQKFESIRVAVENNDRDDIKNIQLDNWEKQVYTLYSLLQLFKFKALQQGLNKPTETTATEDDIKQLGDMLKSKDNNAIDKLTEITNKMKIVK